MARAWIDKQGYARGNIESHSDLIHRQIAYREIYLKNKDKYPLPFSKYVVHHKDGNKLNNEPKNLQILTPEEHERVHDKTREARLFEKKLWEGIDKAVEKASPLGKCEPPKPKPTPLETFRWRQEVSELRVPATGFPAYAEIILAIYLVLTVTAILSL